MSTQRYWACAVLAFGLAFPLAGGQAVATDIEWRGIIDDDWDKPLNWVPFFPGRIPGDGDRVAISDTTRGSVVTLSSDVGELGPPPEGLVGLKILNGFDLVTNGHLLHVTDLGNAETLIRGLGSRIIVAEYADEVQAFDTDLLLIDSGGDLVLDGGLVHVDIEATIKPVAFPAFEQGYLGGEGTIVFGTGSPNIVSGAVLVNDGTIYVAPASPGATLTLQTDPTKTNIQFDLDGESNDGVLDVDDSSSADLTLIVDGPQADRFKGTLLIGEADTANFTNAWSTEQAAVELNGGTGVATLTGAQVTAHSGSVFTVTGTARLDANVTIRDGASLNLDDAEKLIIGGDTIVNDTRLPFNLNLDGDSQNNIVTIEDGASLTLNAAKIDNDPGDDTFSGNINIYNGTLVANIDGGWESDGRILLQGGELAGTLLTNSDRIVGYGTVATSGLSNDGQIRARFGDTLTLDNNPSWVLHGASAGGRLIAEEGDIEILHDVAGPFLGEMEINDGHEISVGGILAIGATGTLKMNEGTLQVATDFTQSGTMDVSGTAASTIEAGNGILFPYPGTNDINADLRLVGDSQIPADSLGRFATFPGTGRLVNRPGSTMQIDNSAIIGVTLRNEGRLVVGEVVASPRIPGKLELVQDFQQSATGVLALEIGGKLRNQYDHLDVHNLAELDGEVIVDLVDIGSGVFVPAVGDTFEIIFDSALPVSGKFATLTAPHLVDGVWDILYNPTFLPTSAMLGVFYAADFDRDGDVDGADFLIWQTSFLTDDGGDADGDGDTDGEDFLIWQGSFPSPGRGAVRSATPEPAAIVLLLVALSGATGFARRR